MRKNLTHNKKKWIIQHFAKSIKCIEKHKIIPVTKLNLTTHTHAPRHARYAHPNRGEGTLPRAPGMGPLRGRRRGPRPDPLRGLITPDAPARDAFGACRSREQHLNPPLDFGSLLYSFANEFHLYIYIFYFFSIRFGFYSNFFVVFEVVCCSRGGFRFFFVDLVFRHVFLVP